MFIFSCGSYAVFFVLNNAFSISAHLRSIYEQEPNLIGKHANFNIIEITSLLSPTDLW